MGAPRPAPRVSLRNVRAVAGAQMVRTDHHEQLLRDGVIPALKACEGVIAQLEARLAAVEALEAARQGSLWARLRWLVTGR